MNVTQRLLSVGVIAMLFLLSACNNDNEKTSGLSKNDAKQALASFNNKGTTELQKFANAEGVSAMQEFFALASTSDPFGRVESDEKKFKAFLRDKGRAFKSVFAPISAKGRVANEGPFDYAGNKGIYEWNDELQDFEKTGNASTIRLLFPTEGSSSNNAELQITALEEVLVKGVYEIKVLKASLSVDNTNVAGVDLSLQWGQDGLPVSGNMSLTLKPYTATLTFSNAAATSSEVSLALLNNNETLVATALRVNYKNATKEAINSVDGYVQLLELKLQGTADFTNEKAESINDIFKLALYSNNAKVGDIVFKADTSGVEVAYLRYADGSEEKLEDALRPIITELENLSDDFGV